MLIRARSLHADGSTLAAAWLNPLVLPLLARLTLAGVFWRSLLTKVEVSKHLTYVEYINDFPVERARIRLPELPLDVKPSVYQQFAGDFALPLLAPEVAAWMAVLAEFAFPVLLLLGLFTRLSALALLAMTLVIQLFVYPEAWWATHALWAVIALYLIVQGPGWLSLDRLAGRLFAR
ncbi:DoxX family protein [Maricaulis sp. CAU 1757]